MCQVEKDFHVDVLVDFIFFIYWCFMVVSLFILLFRYFSQGGQQLPELHGAHKAIFAPDLGGHHCPVYPVRGPEYTNLLCFFRVI